MANFGPIGSSFGNVLFNPMAVDHAVQGAQRNQLMMETAREDQTFQRENQRAAVFERDRGLAGQLAGSVLSLPPAERPAAYAQGLAMYQREGRLPHAPAAYPGDDHMQRLYTMTLTPTQLEARRTQDAERTGLAGMFGGAPAAPGGAPASAPAGATTATAPPELMPHFEEASRLTGVPVPILVAQAKQESNFNPNAVGRSGEIGIGQIMPSTARQPGYGMQGVDPATLNDPRANIMFQAQYLAARNRGVDWNNPQQRDAALGRYNGGGDPNYAANVGRNLPGGAPQQQAAAAPPPPPTPPGGVAARTGGTDTAGPGAGPAPAPASGIALNPPGTPSWAQGTTAEDQVRLRALAGSRGMTQEKLIDEASKMAQANRLQQRWEQAHPAAGGDAAPFGGTGMDAQSGNILLRLGPKIADGSATPAERQQYALAHGHMTRGTNQLVDDGKGGQVLARIPGVVPEGFPAPNFRPGSPEAAPAAAPGAAQPIAGTERAAHPTADQGKVATFANRIADALPEIEAHEAALTNRWERGKAGLPLIGNALVSGSFQRGSQAERAFINSTLRRESGAVISDSEFASARQQYIPQPDDQPDTLRQKKAARERLLQDFVRESGPAYTRTGVAGPNGQGSAEPPARGGATSAHPPLPPGFQVVQ